ncbi:MAG TPA: OmpA family protein [Puia sp.]
MSSTLIDSVKSAFTDNLLSKVSVLLGETEIDIHNAVHGAIPMVLTDIIHKAHFTEGVTKITNLARLAAASDFSEHFHTLSTNMGGPGAGSSVSEKGADFARNLLASHTDPVIGEISRYAGISIPSAFFITELVSFVSLDAIGRHIMNFNVDDSGLGNRLKAQADSILHAIPVGLHVRSALGIDHYPLEEPASARKNKGLYLLLTLVVLALMVFFLYRSCGTAQTTPSATKDTTTAPEAGRNTAAFSSIQVTLPNGKVLKVYQGGTEDRLVNFLNDPHAKLDKKNGNWFDFTQIGFAGNSPSLLLGSEEQLKNIVAILGAFPKVKIRIGGYSDNTGDSRENARLSQQRVDNLLKKLKDLGAKPSQLIGAEGDVTNHPAGAAAGRTLNRRMSLNVKAK